MNLSLELHHLDVHGGDATAVIVRDLDQNKTLYRLLIDSGAEGSGSAYLASYLTKHLEGTKFDCIIATHYHQDHIQGFAQAGISFDHFMDNGGYMASDVKVEPPNGVGYGVKGCGFFSSYCGVVEKQEGAKRVSIPFIEKGFIGPVAPVKMELGVGTGIFLTCYCANGILSNGKNVLDDQNKGQNGTYNPNDLSMAFIIEWERENFSYFTAGDLSGDPTLRSYYNVEKELIDYLTNGTDGLLKGKTVTVLKASHHGSEHSNQKELFDKLRPETVIVSCNMPKRVPSPIFLGRLKEYFTSNDEAKVLFSNSLHVYKSDERYKELSEIKANLLKENVEFIAADGEEIASNLGIKSVVIRRRSGGIKFEGALSKDLLKIERNGYEILLRKRDPKEKEDVKSLMKFSAFDIKIPFEEAIKGDIFDGFNDQAKDMAKWIEKDKNQKKSLGQDYIEKYYPGLTKTLSDNKNSSELEKEFYSKMTAFFQDYFKLKPGGFYGPSGSASLKSTEKQTLCALMINNSRQEAFNSAARLTNYPPGRPYSWKQEGAWNYSEEPYSDEVAMDVVEAKSRKRKRVSEPPSRKKQKTS